MQKFIDVYICQCLFDNTILDTFTTWILHTTPAVSIDKITLPTRFSNKHGTLIDNIYCKLTDMTLNTTSGILIKKKVSNHQPYFTFLNDIFHKTSPPKLIKINNQNLKSISNFQNELTELNIMSQLDSSPTANPNDNYKILHNIIETAKNKRLPLKTVKYNKYKHKKTKWITNGLLKSIYYRDDLYKKVKMLNTESRKHALLSAHLKHIMRY